jgi:dGTPase
MGKIGDIVVEGKFYKVGIYEKNLKWAECIKRENVLYHRDSDIRSEFSRDYNRIIHSNAYRRLKHKTQVFFATRNDHICTRIEHVTHVASISYSIAKFLGLDTELTNAIAVGHDLGHAPFGHKGEEVLKKITEEKIEKTFWHEQNSLNFVDNIEVLLDENAVLTRGRAVLYE